MITTCIVFGFTSSITWFPTGPRSRGTRGSMNNGNSYVQEIIYSTDRNILSFTVPWVPNAKFFNFLSCGSVLEELPDAAAANCTLD